jgi:NitT/TauT family transport system ATP-binding protein
MLMPEITRQSLTTSPEASMDALIEIDGVGKTFTGQDGEQIVALEGTDLKIGRGEFVSIVGPSGCGKSTLLNLVAGLLETTMGEVRIDGKTVDGPYTDLGFAFQSDLLLDWRSVLRNVLLQCDMRGSIPGNTRPARASCCTPLVSTGSKTSDRSNCQAVCASVWRCAGHCCSTRPCC